MKNSSAEYRFGFMEGWLSVAANVILFGLKYWAGIITGSVALIADAWHTLSDSISSVVLLIGLRIAVKPADKKHPFGHGRAEIIASIVIGFILVLIGFNFLRESVERLKDHKSVIFGTIAIVVTAVSAVVKELLARYALWAGRKEASNSLRADAWHHRSDALSSVVILIGIFLGRYFWWIDGVLGIIVSAWIFYTAYQIIESAASSLLGEIPEKDVLKRIEEIAAEIHEKDLRLHHFHIHKYGNHSEMTFHIVLPRTMRLEEAARVTQDLFERIKEEMNIVATIHIDTESIYKINESE